MHLLFRLLPLSVLFIAFDSAHALFAMQDVESVPVERLIVNLSRDLAADPANPRILFALARAHSLAYAQKGGDAEVLKDRKDVNGPNFSPGSNNIPFEVEASTEPAKLTAARKNIDRAIDLYRQLMTAEPKNLIAWLGLAWSLEQAGQKDAAIAEYRKIIGAAWAEEKDATSAGPAAPFIAEEASGYLSKLLSPAQDSKEIADLHAKQQHFKALPRMVTPIAIPLDNQAGLSEIVARDVRVAFDLDGSGLPQCTQWITPRAAWLVYQPKRAGVNSSLQLFGNNTFWVFWNNGFAALAALDDDGDTVISGAELEGLALWHDRNSDGMSSDTEVRPIEFYGIIALATGYRLLTDGTPASKRGVRFADGSVRASYDVILQTTRLNAGVRRVSSSECRVAIRPASGG